MERLWNILKDAEPRNQNRVSWLSPPPTRKLQALALESHTLLNQGFDRRSFRASGLGWWCQTLNTSRVTRVNE